MEGVQSSEFGVKIRGVHFKTVLPRNPFSMYRSDAIIISYDEA